MFMSTEKTIHRLSLVNNSTDNTNKVCNAWRDREPFHSIKAGVASHSFLRVVLNQTHCVISKKNRQFPYIIKWLAHNYALL